MNMVSYNNAMSQFDRDETERSGIKMSPAQRSVLMQNLMASRGPPVMVLHSLTLLGISIPTPGQANPASAVPLSPCTISLMNVFDPTTFVHPFCCFVVVFALLDAVNQSACWVVERRCRSRVVLAAPLPDRLRITTSDFPCAFFCSFFCRETEPDWDVDLRADMIEECTKYGPVLHVAIDKRDRQVCLGFHPFIALIQPGNGVHEVSEP